ncbi:hypothetical protein [Polynucleobacter antarcticus]|uniref:Uncharacterized protein n=1 Tax=Polynucleobacter antarcticus TaxID=1743162 RepID=A0A6M9PI66_9BURK|nr:hypothetical protein [Polynucleobacter antarcticus]QKM61834.1 hypothetical protein DCO16_01300 [Polynucleobacter antarcticus]
MIIAWVLSLLLLLSSLVFHLERLASLEIISTHTGLQSSQQFIAAEKALLECEQHLSNITEIINASCHIQSAGKNRWLLSSKEMPTIEILVLLDEKTHTATRLNWRQKFDPL